VPGKEFLFIGFVLMAIFGACVKWVNSLKTAPSTWSVLITDVFTAAFIGCVVGNINEWLQYDRHMAYAVAGMSGHWGTKSIGTLQAYVMKRAGIDITVNESNVEEDITVINERLNKLETTLEKKENDE